MPPHPRRFAATLLLLALVGAQDAAPTQRPPRPRIEVPPAPETRPDTAAETVPREQLEPMYARELGKLYKPADADRVYDAHVLLESFFAEPAANARKDVLQKLRDTK